MRLYFIVRGILGTALFSLGQVSIYAAGVNIALLGLAVFLVAILIILPDESWDIK